MFGFGKKSFDRQAQADIFLNLTLFQSWSLDIRRKDLNTSDLIFIAGKIADRLKVKATKDDLQGLAFMALQNMEFEQIRALRLSQNFDSQAIDFCKNLGLRSEWYSK